jgi:hypothetical protein
LFPSSSASRPPVIPITAEISTWFIASTGEIRIEVLHGT